MGDLLGSLVWGAKNGQYCVIGGESLQMVSEPLPSLRWWERAQAQWGTPAGTLGPKRGWLWRPTSPGNEDVLICINAPFITQRVLKPWWPWTYQNSAVKRASARAILGWVISWEVWFREPKANNIVSLGVGRYTYSSSLVEQRSLTQTVDYFQFFVYWFMLFCWFNFECNCFHWSWWWLSFGLLCSPLLVFCLFFVMSK